MADKTIGEIYADNSGVPASTSKMEWENAAGTASGGSTVDELAQATAFSDRFVPLTGAITPVAATGSTENIDLDVAYHELNMDEDCTFTPTNKAASGEVKISVAYITGAFTPAFHADVDFGDTGGPTYSDGIMLVLTSRNGETKVNASAVATGGFT